MDAPTLKAEWSGFKGHVAVAWDRLSEQDLIRIEGDLTYLVDLIQEKYQQPKEKVEEKLRELFNLYLEKKEKMKESISELKDQVSERSQNILEGVKEKSAQYTEAAKQKIDQIKRENIDPAVQKSEEYIKLNPFTAVLGALGAGIVVGGIIGYLLRNKN